METIVSVMLIVGLLALWTRIIIHSPLLLKNAIDAKRPPLPGFARISSPIPRRRKHLEPRKAA